MAQITKDRVDLYPLTHVDCIEKAICCMLNEYDETWESLYLLYNNWSRCFEVEQENNSEVGILEYLCNEGKFPLEFRTCKVGEKSVSEEVEKHLESGEVCLVPANLYELFYSKHFHHNDWPHLIFVRKCDKDERLLYIMDSCQKQENEEVFSPFVMEYDKLDKIYKAYCDTFPSNLMYHDADVFYTFCMGSDREKKVDIDTFGQFILERTVTLYDGQKEKKMLDFLLEDQTSYTKETRNNIDSFLGDKKIKFNQMIKRKMVFYTELIYSLFSCDEELVEQLKQELSALIVAWNTYYRIMIAGMLRKHMTDLWDKLCVTIEKEKNFLNSMSESYEKCKRDFDKCSLWILENEEPDEIKVEENCIYMQTQKDHNAWFQDEALEAICTEQNEMAYHDIFQIRVNMISGYENSNFHAGIVVKTRDERMYIWGCYNEESLRLSDIGVKVDLNDFSISSLLNLKLSAIVEKNSLRLVAENEAAERQEVLLEDIVTYIKKIGVVLKTWENDYHDAIKVEFEILKPES